MFCMIQEIIESFLQGVRNMFIDVYSVSTRYPLGAWLGRGVTIKKHIIIDLFHVSWHLDQFEGS